MQTIRDLLSRDLSEQIEEVIKVDQQDEKTVHNELTKYAFTDRIEDQYRELLDAIAEGPSTPTEGVGLWISAFFDCPGRKVHPFYSRVLIAHSVVQS